MTDKAELLRATPLEDASAYLVAETILNDRSELSYKLLAQWVLSKRTRLQSEAEGDDAFQALVAKAICAGHILTLAHKCAVTPGTVYRWAIGTANPLSGFKEGVREILKTIEAEGAGLTAEARSVIQSASNILFNLEQAAGPGSNLEPTQRTCIKEVREQLDRLTGTTPPGKAATWPRYTTESSEAPVDPAPVDGPKLVDVEALEAELTDDEAQKINDALGWNDSLGTIKTIKLACNELIKMRAFPTLLWAMPTREDFYEFIKDNTFATIYDTVGIHEGAYERFIEGLTGPGENVG